MIIDKKIMKFMAHRYNFFDFWRFNCDGKETAEQLQIIYDKSHVWFGRLISCALTDENKKKYALFIAQESIKTLKEENPKESLPDDDLPLYVIRERYVKLVRKSKIGSNRYYMIMSIVYSSECIEKDPGTLHLSNALEKSFKCSDLRDKIFEFGSELIKLQESSNIT